MKYAYKLKFGKNRIYIFLQWKPLNVITDNVTVIRFTQISKPVPNNPLLFTEYL
jgi:hypothetical protein